MYSVSNPEFSLMKVSFKKKCHFEHPFVHGTDYRVFVRFLGSLHADQGIPGPYLVVVPLSTIAAWKREFAKWAPWMNVIEYRGNVQARAVCRQYEWGPGRMPLF